MMRTTMTQDKSYEQMMETRLRQIRETREKILEDFYHAYAAHLMHLGIDVDLTSICLNEMHGIDDNSKAYTKYWFTYKPEFEND